MQIKKNDINKIFVLFLFSHIIIWTLIPSFTNINLPLDTIEALAWSNELQLGYHKPPPLAPFLLAFYFKIFGNQDWAYYLLSQLTVAASFIIIFIFSFEFLKNRIHSLISVLLLEGIYFYNFTTPEFNPILLQLPLCAASALYCWKAINQNDNISWILFGFFSALSVLTFYLSFYLLLSLCIFFIIKIIETKKFNPKYLITLSTFFVLLLPHLIWVLNNDFISIRYGLFRSFGDPLTGLTNIKFLDHLLYPIIFLGKQFVIIIPFLIMFFLIIRKFKVKINFKDKKLFFLLSITILPIILWFLTSLVSGARIRTMWMPSFYLFIGILFIYLFEEKIKLKKIKNFFIVFLFLFIFSPSLYFYNSITQTNQRTDYPGKKIATIVQTQWDSNFSNKIEIVIGYGWIDGWYAQNLSYHLKSRPKWKMKSKKDSANGTVWIKDFGAINECSGIMYQIDFYNDICMVGKK